MTSENPPDDRVLLDGWRQGDQAAATEFYQRNVEKLLYLVQRNIAARFSSRFDADDIVQSVMRTVFRQAQAGGINVADSNELWRLISVIALNKVRNRVKKESAQKNSAARTVSGSELFPMIAEPLDQDAVEVADLLEAVSNALDPNAAATLRLLLEERSQDEIAETIGVTTRSVRRYKEMILEQLSQLAAD